MLTRADVQEFMDSLEPVKESADLIYGVLDSRKGRRALARNDAAIAELKRFLQLTYLHANSSYEIARALMDRLEPQDEGMLSDDGAMLK